MQRMSGNSSEICRQLESWYLKPGGRYLAECEKQLVETQLQQVFGYHLLQVGITRIHPLAEDTLLNHKIYAAAHSGGDVGLLTEADSLPFPNDSIDVVVLHHALEFAEDPHALLREAHRVVAPQGQLLILGFNPVSLAGLGRILRRLWPRSTWRKARPMSFWRLRDWIRLLGAEVMGVNHGWVIPPVGKGRLFRFLSRSDGICSRLKLPLGGVYAVRAQKHVSSLTPTRLGWQRKMGARLIGLSVPGAVPSPREGAFTT